jgi:hypothetical protein
MSKREFDLLRDLREQRPFADLYAVGLSPAQVKQELFDLFAPYSINHAALDWYVVRFMVSDAINLKSILQSSSAMALLKESLRIHHEAIRCERRAGLTALGLYTGAINDGLSTFWSQYHLARDLNELEIEEFLHECLRQMGSFIEGPFKPHLCELAHQARIARGRKTHCDEVLGTSVGGLINELCDFAGGPELYSISGVRFSQWRNVAQHLSARIEGDLVVCEFGPRRSVRLSRAELVGIYKQLVDAYKALKVGHAIVVFDFLDEMKQARLLITPARTQRAESSLLVFASGLASQGFEVVEMHLSSDESRIVLRDMSTLDVVQRRTHATQFLIPLFHEKPADTVVVEYREFDGTPSLRADASRELIERAERAGDWTLVAAQMHVTDLKIHPQPNKALHPTAPHDSRSRAKGL